MPTYTLAPDQEDLRRNLGLEIIASSPQEAIDKYEVLGGIIRDISGGHGLGAITLQHPTGDIETIELEIDPEARLSGIDDDDDDDDDDEGLTDLDDDDKLQYAEEAIDHLLEAITYDPAKYWLLGAGTGSWDKLLKAHAALHGLRLSTARAEWRPDSARHTPWQKQREADERLLIYCRENNIIVPTP